MRDLAILILAAGGSRRMGQPKQLLELNGQSLIYRTALSALGMSPSEVVVVLGNAFDQIREEITDLGLSIVHNTEWEKGMAGSLQMGIQTLEHSAKHFDAVLILLCDQPLVDTIYLNRLAQAYRSIAFPAAASAYNNILGVPAIFDWEVLRQFAKEDGDHGARYLIKVLAKEGKVVEVDFPEGAIDLDTPEAYKAFLMRQPNEDSKS